LQICSVHLFFLPACKFRLFTFFCFAFRDDLVFRLPQKGKGGLHFAPSDGGYINQHFFPPTRLVFPWLYPDALPLPDYPLANF